MLRLRLRVTRIRVIAGQVWIGGSLALRTLFLRARVRGRSGGTVAPAGAAAVGLAHDAREGLARLAFEAAHGGQVEADPLVLPAPGLPMRQQQRAPDH